MHLILIVFLILFSSNLWSLTFKDGKQVNEDAQIEVKIQKASVKNNVQTQTQEAFNFEYEIKINNNNEYEVSIVSEITSRDTELFNIKDINGDGKDDFIISTMIDVRDYGKKHWDIVYDDAINLPNVPSYLVYSNQNSYSVISLPINVWSKRMFFATSFKLNNKTYLALARNGEVGKPSENPGEEIAIIEIKFNSEKPLFLKTFFESEKTVTAHIDTFIDTDQGLNLIVSNYGKIQPTTHFKYKVYDSVIYKFYDEKGLEFTGLVPFTKDINAHNTMRVADINKDGHLDFMGAAEIWNGFNSDFQDNKPGSYIVLDWFNKTNNRNENNILLNQLESLLEGNEVDWPNAENIYNEKGAIKILLKPLFEDQHSGWDLNYLNIHDEIFIIEASSLKTKQLVQNQFSKCALSFYNLKEAEIIDEQTFNKWYLIEPSKVMRTNNENCSMGKILKYDIDKDGIEDIFYNKLQGKKNYYTFKDNNWTEVPLPYNVIGGENSAKEIDYTLLYDEINNCSNLASSFSWEKTKRIRVNISNCI